MGLSAHASGADNEILGGMRYPTITLKLLGLQWFQCRSMLAFRDRRVRAVWRPHARCDDRDLLAAHPPPTTLAEPRACELPKRDSASQ